MYQWPSRPASSAAKRRVSFSHITRPCGTRSTHCLLRERLEHKHHLPDPEEGQSGSGRPNSQCGCLPFRLPRTGFLGHERCKVRTLRTHAVSSSFGAILQLRATYCPRARKGLSDGVLRQVARDDMNLVAFLSEGQSRGEADDCTSSAGSARIFLPV